MGQFFFIEYRGAEKAKRTYHLVEALFGFDGMNIDPSQVYVPAYADYLYPKTLCRIKPTLLLPSVAVTL